MNQQDGQRQSTRGRYLMEIKENRENQEINRSTEETNHLDREKEGWDVIPNYYYKRWANPSLC